MAGREYDRVMRAKDGEMIEGVREAASGNGEVKEVLEVDEIGEEAVIKE